MGDKEAAGQQPADDEKQAGAAGSIYGGGALHPQPDKTDDPGSTGPTDSGEPGTDTPGDGDDGPPDDGSIYGG